MDGEEVGGAVGGWDSATADLDQKYRFQNQSQHYQYFIREAAAATFSVLSELVTELKC